MEQHTLRPFVTTGIAVVGASLVAVAPVVTPLPADVQTRAVALMSADAADVPAVPGSLQTLVTDFLRSVSGVVSGVESLPHDVEVGVLTQVANFALGGLGLGNLTVNGLLADLGLSDLKVGALANDVFPGATVNSLIDNLGLNIAPATLLDKVPAGNLALGALAGALLGTGGPTLGTLVGDLGLNTTTLGTLVKDLFGSATGGPTLGALTGDLFGTGGPTLGTLVGDLDLGSTTLGDLVTDLFGSATGGPTLGALAGDLFGTGGPTLSTLATELGLTLTLSNLASDLFGSSTGGPTLGGLAKDLIGTGGPTLDTLVHDLFGAAGSGLQVTTFADALGLNLGVNDIVNALFPGGIQVYQFANDLIGNPTLYNLMTDLQLQNLTVNDVLNAAGIGQIPLDAIIPPSIGNEGLATVVDSINPDALASAGSTVQNIANEVTIYDLFRYPNPESGGPEIYVTVAQMLAGFGLGNQSLYTIFNGITGDPGLLTGTSFGWNGDTGATLNDLFNGLFVNGSTTTNLGGIDLTQLLTELPSSGIGGSTKLGSETLNDLLGSLSLGGQYVTTLADHLFVAGHDPTLGSVLSALFGTGGPSLGTLVSDLGLGNTHVNDLVTDLFGTAPPAALTLGVILTNLYGTGGPTLGALVGDLVGSTQLSDLVKDLFGSAAGGPTLGALAGDLFTTSNPGPTLGALVGDLDLGGTQLSELVKDLFGTAAGGPTLGTLAGDLFTTSNPGPTLGALVSDLDLGSTQLSALANDLFPGGGPTLGALMHELFGTGGPALSTVVGDLLPANTDMNDLLTALGVGTLPLSTLMGDLTPDATVGGVVGDLDFGAMTVNALFGRLGVDVGASLANILGGSLPLPGAAAELPAGLGPDLLPEFSTIWADVVGAF